MYEIFIIEDFFLLFENSQMGFGDVKYRYPCYVTDALCNCIFFNYLVSWELELFGEVACGLVWDGN